MPSELEISYGWKGCWSVDERREADYAHMRAQRTVIEGLELLGVQFLQPEVRIDSTLVGSEIPAPAGSCGGTNKINIYIHDLHLGEDADIDELILTEVHELIHVGREQLIPFVFTSLERWATEGLAYFGEDYISRNFFGRSTEVARDSRLADPNDIKDWQRSLVSFYGQEKEHSLVLPSEHECYMASSASVESLYDASPDTWSQLMRAKAQEIITVRKNTL